MISLLNSIPKDIHRFRADPWPYQKTLQTPRKNMANFLSILLAVYPVDRGVASTDQVVFEPDDFLALLKSRELSIDNYWTFCVEASNSEDVPVLLDAMLDDWIDFVFVPSPQNFAIYADHDEFLTLYAPTASGLSQLVDRLALAGFEFQDWYVRPSGGNDLWR